MTPKYILLSVLLWYISSAFGQDHTRFVDLPLSMPADSLVNALADKGLQQQDRFEMSGRIAGLDIWLYINVGKDSSTVNNIMLTSQELQGKSLEDNYHAITQWMRHHYGSPNWEGKVRSHPFARWYVGFDKDIIVITTASTGIEVWFYNNHLKRNVDYYAILKYCESKPVEGVPQLTAQECVTWKSTGDSTYRAKVKKKKSITKNRKTIKRKKYAKNHRNRGSRMSRRKRNSR